MIPFVNAHLCGLIPEFFSRHDPRPAAEQLHENYAHGGGFRPFKGFKLVGDAISGAKLLYPGDRPMRQIAFGKLREETLIVFEYSWLAIIQPDGSYVVCHVD